MELRSRNYGGNTCWCCEASSVAFFPSVLSVLLVGVCVCVGVCVLEFVPLRAENDRNRRITSQRALALTRRPIELYSRLQGNSYPLPLPIWEYGGIWHDMYGYYSPFCLSGCAPSETVLHSHTPYGTPHGTVLRRTFRTYETATTVLGATLTHCDTLTRHTSRSLSGYC